MLDALVLGAIGGLCVLGLVVVVRHRLQWNRAMREYRAACRAYDARCDEVDRRNAEDGDCRPYGPVPTLWPYFVHRRGQPIP